MAALIALACVKSSWERLVYWALRDRPENSRFQALTCIMLGSIYVISLTATMVTYAKVFQLITQAHTG